MKMTILRKRLPAALALLACSTLLFAFTEGVPANAICPITRKPADAAKTVIYTKEVTFCCEDCKTKFNQNPDGKVVEIAAAGPGVKKCLMCDKPADGAIKAAYSRLVAVSDATCLPVFTANPDEFIVFAVTHPRPVNTLCPVSGEKVDLTCTVDYQKTVLFCSPQCHEALNKAPDKSVDRIVKFAAAKGTCVLCDNKFDPAHSEVYRRTIGFSNPAHAGTFKSDPDAHLARAIESGK